MKILKKYFGVMLLLTALTGSQAQNITEVSTVTTPVSCGGATDGTITVTVEGGLGNLNYSLMQEGVFVEFSTFIPDRSYTFSNYKKSIDYTIFVSDANSGTQNLVVSTAIGGPDPIMITGALTTDVNCAGIPDGTITVAATGEDGNLVYDLSGPVTRQSISGFFDNLPAGSYDVTVSHGTCFSTYDTTDLIIDTPPPLAINLDNIVPVNCFGESTGALEITPSGGTPSGTGTGYAYSWTSTTGYTSTQEDISGIPAGDYTVVVTDNNGCTAMLGPVTVSQSPEIQINVNNTENVSCDGGNDGSVSITAAGGTPGYTFLWEGLFTGTSYPEEDPTTLVADTYSLTVTDALSCTKTFANAITITEPDPITYSIESITNVKCNGGSDATADLTISGGTLPYGFSWTSDGTYTSAQEDPTGMPAGTYSLVITDGEGCIQSFPDIFTITEPNLIVAVLDGFSDVRCFGGNDGTAEVTISEGTPPYSVRWIGDVTGYVSTSEDPLDLIADTYDLEVTDNNGCVQVFNDIAVIDQPVDITATFTIINVNCNGAFTGEISVVPLGGTPPFNFAWTGPNGYNSNDQNISGLEAGSYDLTITDAHGCQKDFLNNTVVQNSAITATFVVTNLTCNEAGNGEIDVTVNGGTPPYSFNWSGDNGYINTTDLDIAGLDAANYTLTVRDALGCEQEFPVQPVTEPDPLNATFSPVNATCSGADNGAINVTVSGGTPEYGFLWSGPGSFSETTEDVSGLEPGSYSLVLTDANGCLATYTDAVTITEPTEITVVPTSNDISCNGAGDGTISIAVSGGTPGYTYAWSGPGGYSSDQPNLGSLGPGTYSLTVTDANDCSELFNNLVTINEPPAIDVTFTGQDNLDCFGDSDGSVSIDVSGGVAPYTFSWTNNEGTIVSTDEDPSGLTAGTYSLLVTDNTLCSASYPDAVEITEPLPLTLTLTMTPALCTGESNGTVTAAASGGTPAYRYSLSPGGPFTPPDNFNGLPAGPVTVYTLDANGCTAEATITVEEPQPISITSATGIPAACNGTSTGQIIVTVEGGNPGYTFTLSPALLPPQNNGTFAGLPAGDYSVEVDDTEGCGPVPSGNITITEPTALQVDSVTIQKISCNSDTDGKIEVFITGGTPPYAYSADNGTTYQADSAFTSLAAGTYEIHVKDANECPLYIDSYTLDDPPAVSITGVVTDVTPCFGGTNGAIAVTASGGWNHFLYSIDDVNFQTTGDFTGLTGGTYTVIVLDSGNCRSTAEFTVDQPEEVTADIARTNYTGDLLGTITIAGASGGTPPYDYSISGPGGTFTSTTSYADLVLGTYEVVVRDALGCMYQETIEIFDIIPLAMMVNTTNVSCFGLQNGMIEFLPQDAEGAVYYSIDNGASYVTTPLFENLPGDSTYLLRAYDDAAKEYSGSVTINVPAELTVFASVSPADCNAFSETGAVELTIGGGTGMKTVDWSNGSSGENLTNALAGKHTYTVTDENGCIDTGTVNIPSYVIVNAQAGKDTTVCAGTTLILDAVPGDVMRWEPSTNLDNTGVPNPVITNITETMEYTYMTRETTSGFNCYDIDTIMISVLPNYGIEITQDTFTLKGQPIQLQTFTDGNFVEYQWIPENGLDQADIPDPEATILATTLYILLATNDFGCVESDSVLIELVEDLTVYNAFSPNGDYANEYFEIDNASRFPDIVVQVFNRWGSRVFYSEGYSDDKRWDGTFNGKEAPVGTYYYVIIPKPGATPITGNVTIIR